MCSQSVVAPLGTQRVRLARGVDIYVAAPNDGNALGGVIVAGEIFGITTHVRDICERLARAGHFVAAPDFYWRQQRGTCLSYDARGRRAGVRMLRLLQREKVVADVAAIRAYLATGSAQQRTWRSSESAPEVISHSSPPHACASRWRCRSTAAGWSTAASRWLHPHRRSPIALRWPRTAASFSASPPATAIVSSPPNSGVDSTSCSVPPGSSTNWSDMRVRGTGFPAPNDPRPSMPKRVPTCGGGCSVLSRPPWQMPSGRLMDRHGRTICQVRSPSDCEARGGCRRCEFVASGTDR